MEIIPGDKNKVARIALLLRTAGSLREIARLNGRKLSDADLRFVLSARRLARDHKITRSLARFFEREGAALVRSNV